MEGRYPPPPARHLFPDDPTPINKKFWGTQSMRGFFAFGASFVGICASILVINGYLTRNEDRVLFFKVNLSQEFMRKRADMISAEGKSKWRNMYTGYETVHNQFFLNKNHPPDHDLRLDDSVRMNPPHRDQANNLRIR